MHASQVPSGPERETVYAPIDGKITHADEETGVVTVYVSKSDSHIIYAPTSGTILYTVEEHGMWLRPGVFNVPDQTKTGRLVLCIRTTKGMNYEFWVEVGHGKYITDTIHMDVRQGDYLREKTRIGEIIIGSLYEMHLKMCRTATRGDALMPQHINTIELVRGKGSTLKGGVSSIALLT